MWDSGALRRKRKMKRRNPTFSSQEDSTGLKGFDDYQLRLGDLMRGERATLGKSLLDVQRELRIKASYISAIENCDAEAFDTPSFIAGYVKSYAKYLGMDPDEVFKKFCTESSFTASYDISAKSHCKKTNKVASAAIYSGSTALGPVATRFVPPQKSLVDFIDARAIGSTMIMAALVSSIGFGAWSVLKEVQRVQVSPVENTPLVLSDLDPISEIAFLSENQNALPNSDGPSSEFLDRLYRPQALEVPILVSRDAPISSLDPSQIGNFKVASYAVDTPQEKNASNIGLAEVLENSFPSIVPKVVEDPPPTLALFAVRAAWVQVKAADGSTIYERIMNPGEEFVLPQSEIAPKLRAGMSGSLYFAVNGTLYGPAGDGATVVKQIPLSVDDLTQTYQIADIQTDPQLQKIVAEAEFSSFTISSVLDTTQD